MFKLIIFGTSTFRDYDLLEVKADYFLSNKDNVEIISGGQRSITKKTGYMYGADFFGELYAAYRGYPIRVFEADWEAYGKPAGPIRNEQMGAYGDAGLGFWNGFSIGTANMISILERLKKPCRVVRY